MSASLERIELFLLAYASLIIFMIVVLSSLEVSELDVYVAAIIIGYFIAILATAPHFPFESRRERIIGVMLLVVFAVILIQHVVLLLR
jgi:hypothetical protein